MTSGKNQHGKAYIPILTVGFILYAMRLYQGYHSVKPYQLKKKKKSQMSVFF